jgi:hypothetical protein
MSIIFKNKSCHLVALFQEFVDRQVNGRPSLFPIDIVQMETSLSHALLFFNTKSMVISLKNLEILATWKTRYEGKSKFWPVSRNAVYQCGNCAKVF